MALINCPNCKATISDKTKVCPKCGYTFTAKIETIYTTQQTQQSTNKSICSKWLFTVLAILIVGCGISYLIYTSLFASSEKVSDKIGNNISNDSMAEVGQSLNKTHEIGISKAECTYHLPQSKIATYTADNLIDNNIETAWAVNLDSPIYDSDVLFGPVFIVNCNTVSEVVIVNGYGKDETSFLNNTRAAWITIYRVENMEGEFPDDSDIIYRGNLKDIVEPQKLTVSPNYDNSKPTNKIGLIFSTKNSDGYYFGRKWNDLCISEFKVYGN